VDQQAAVASLVLLAPICSLLAADELLKHVPAGANALMVIDVAALQATPMAQDQGWQKKHEAASLEVCFPSVTTVSEFLRNGGRRKL
jgi:hypothetical protein